MTSYPYQTFYTRPRLENEDKDGQDALKFDLHKCNSLTGWLTSWSIRSFGSFRRFEFTLENNRLNMYPVEEDISRWHDISA